MGVSTDSATTYETTAGRTMYNDPACGEGAMLKLSEAVRTVIDLARVVKGEVEERERQHPLGGMYDPKRKRREPTEAEGRLRDYIRGLPVAVIYTLTLIMYAGRGDFPIDNFLDQYGEMHDTFDSPVRAMGQMLEKVPLPDYLENGLLGLGKAGIDVDRLMTHDEGKS